MKKCTIGRSGLALVAGLLLAQAPAGGGAHSDFGKGGAPAPARPPEMVAHIATYSILRIALMDAAIIDGRVFTLPEVCASPYSPVRCEDLKNPYTNAPLAWRGGEAGEIELVPKTGDYDLFGWTVGPDGKPQRFGSAISTELETLVRGVLAVREGRLDSGHATIDQILAARDTHGPRAKLYDAVRALSNEEKAAYFAGLRTVIQLQGMDEFARGGALSLPAGRFDRLVDYAAAIRASTGPSVPAIVPQAFLLLDRYRNDFSGGYSHQVSAPEPGNYTFQMDSDGTVHFAMYGKNGEVLVRSDHKAGTHPNFRTLPYPDREQKGWASFVFP